MSSSSGHGGASSSGGAAVAPGSADGSSTLHHNLGARKLFDEIVNDPAAVHFKVLPDVLLYPSYYDVIPRPVCLADINMAIASGARYTVADMARDLRRMIANAKKFNLPESQVYLDALVLEVGHGHIMALVYASQLIGAFEMESLQLRVTRPHIIAIDHPSLYI